MGLDNRMYLVPNEAVIDKYNFLRYPKNMKHVQFMISKIYDGNSYVLHNAIKQILGSKSIGNNQYVKLEKKELKQIYDVLNDRNNQQILNVQQDYLEDKWADYRNSNNNAIKQAIEYINKGEFSVFYNSDW